MCSVGFIHDARTAWETLESGLRGLSALILRSPRAMIQFFLPMLEPLVDGKLGRRHHL